MYQHNYVLRADPIQLLSQPNRWRKQAEIRGLSDKAKLRLEWIIFYSTVGERNATVTAKHFGLARSKFYYWLSRFDEKNLSLLEDEEPIPKKKRTWSPDPIILERMIQVRKRFIHWSKIKLSVFYERWYGEPISSWQFQRVIEEFKLYPDKTKQQKRKGKKKKGGKKKERITKELRETLENLYSLDVIVLHDFGKKRYIYTAVGHEGKFAYARVYTSHSSKVAANFLARLRYLVDDQIDYTLTDNGSEFEGEFDEACQAKQLGRYFSRVRTPKDNPEVERFNRTLREEWLDDGNWYENLKTFNQELTEWLVIYNDLRPHESLNYLSPLQYAEANGLLSKRSSSSTSP